MLHLSKIQGGWVHPSYEELHAYLGPAFRPDYCSMMDEKAIVDRAEFKGTDEEWTRQTMVFAYQNIGLATMGIHRPYLAQILMNTADHYGRTIIDYGAGGGQVGLALHFLGFRVSFADIPGQSLLWLMYRLRQLKLNLPVYVLDDEIEIPRHDIAICFDVLEHLPREEQEKTLLRLGSIASVVFANLIRETGEHSSIHGAVDIDGLGSFLAKRWAVASTDYYPDANGVPRQRLVIYGDNVSIA